MLWGNIVIGDGSYSGAYLKVLSKIDILKKGYRFMDEEGKIVEGSYPEEVFEAIAKICSESRGFPTEEELKENEEKNPDYAYLAYYATSTDGLEYLAERTDISKIARSRFGMDVYNEPASREQVDKFIESCVQFLEKNKKQVVSMQSVVSNAIETGVNVEDVSRAKDMQYNTKEGEIINDK